MISILKGTILETGNRHVVMEIGGIGYKVFVTDDALHTLKTDTSTTLWTYLAIRENSQDLYGFTTRKERDFFELLITVSGVGPKTGLNILSLISCDTLASAIRTGSTAHLVKVSGIGRKTAEKIVLELRDKLGAITSEDSSEGMTSDADAIEALKALGYSPTEAREALKGINKDITDIGAKVKAALKMLN